MANGLVAVDFAQHQVLLRISLKRIARRVAVVHVRALGQRPARKRPARAFRIRNSKGIRAGNLADSIGIGSSHAFSKSAALQVICNGIRCQNQFKNSVLTRLNLHERRFQRVAVHGNPALCFLIGIHAERNVGLAIIRRAVVLNEHRRAVINVRNGVLQIIKRHVAERYHVIRRNGRQIQELRSAACAQVAFVARRSQSFIGELDNLHVLTDGAARLNRGNLGLHAVMHRNMLDGIRDLRAFYPASINRGISFNGTILIKFRCAGAIGVPTREIITRVMLFQFFLGRKLGSVQDFTLCHFNGIGRTGALVVQVNRNGFHGSMPTGIKSQARGHLIIARIRLRVLGVNEPAIENRFIERSRWLSQIRRDISVQLQLMAAQRCTLIAIQIQIVFIAAIIEMDLLAIRRLFAKFASLIIALRIAGNLVEISVIIEIVELNFHCLI